MKISVKKDNGYNYEMMKGKIKADNEYLSTFYWHNKPIKAITFKSESIAKAIENAEFELAKVEFTRKHEKFLELIFLLEFNGLNLVEFIKNDLESFNECTCLEDLGWRIEEELCKVSSKIVHFSPQSSPLFYLI